MEVVQSNQMGTEIQSGFWDSILSLLTLNPIFLLGIAAIGILLAVMFRRNKSIPKIKTSVISLLMYYYLCLLFVNIVGIPTFSEFSRLSRLGETFFNPNINLIPFSDGFSLSFILNIFLFIPLGFLCPLISRTYARDKNIILLGLGLSLLIEISQLFTLYRATDINDLLTNVFGAVIGYLCFRLILKLKFIKTYYYQLSTEEVSLKHLPVIIVAIAFVLGFAS